MAGLPPFYADVAFDAARAEAAIDSLQRIRSVVHELGEARARAVPDAIRDWQGRFRDEFDADFGRSQADLGAVEARIDAVIAEIRAGQQDAEDEQAQRLRRRARHEEEAWRRLERARNPPDALTQMRWWSQPPASPPKPDGFRLR